jgi:hypothetical protein
MSFEKIGSHRIYFDETYYLTYAGGKRELAAKDQKEYDKLVHLPFVLQRKEMARLPFDKNPNVIPLKGIQLMSFIKELKFIPFFDTFFEQSKLLKLTDIVIYNAIKVKQYEMAMRQ